MFTDGRSKRVIFLAHCLLNQNAISDGTAEVPAAHREILRTVLDARAGVVQMPCPELCCLGLDRGDPKGGERPVVVDALPVLEQVMRMMSLVAQEKGTELTYRAEGACTVLATRDEIHQIIYNLTDNAVKYTPSGSTVQVSLFREGDQVVLTVEDNGAGIPEEDLPRIFERFYRVDKARSRAAGGTGLGLAIVRDTVEKRGGTVEAANRPGGGAVFTVRWPWREGGGQT